MVSRRQVSHRNISTGKEEDEDEDEDEDDAKDNKKHSINKSMIGKKG